MLFNEVKWVPASANAGTSMSFLYSFLPPFFCVAEAFKFMYSNVTLKLFFSQSNFSKFIKTKYGKMYHLSDREASYLSGAVYDVSMVISPFLGGLIVSKGKSYLFSIEDIKKRQKRKEKENGLSPAILCARKQYFVTELLFWHKSFLLVLR